MKVREAIQKTCDTAIVKPLSLQVIQRMNAIHPGLLVPLDDSRVISAPRVNRYLQAAAHKSLMAALADRPSSTMTLVSCYRTLPQQLMLYRWYLAGRCGIPLAAKPGKSNHEDAAAIDAQPTFDWRFALKRHGWLWQGKKDPAHYSYRGPGFVDSVGNIGVQAFQQLWNANNPGAKISEDGLYGPKTETALLESPVGGW